LEVIVDGCEVDLRLGCDVAERGSVETILSKEFLGGIQKARFSVNLFFNHTFA
jgi:hypothetical protein